MSIVSLRILLWLGLFCVSALRAAGQQPAPQRRPYRIDDYFSTEEAVTSSVTVAPDGKAVAFTLLRAANTQLANSLLVPETRGDIWLQEAPGQPVRNLTNGRADSSGWWAPQWSPDGQRLAFLSSRGGEVRIWAWDRARDEVRKLSNHGIEFSDAGGCRWVDAIRLLCLAVPEGEQSTPTHRYYGKPVERAEAAWAKAKRGELTASVVNSLEFKLPRRRLVMVDVPGGTSHTLGTTQLLDMNNGYFLGWWLSPARQAVAFVRAEAAAYEFTLRHRLGFPATVELRRLDGEPLRLNRALPTNVVTSTLQWSPDGQTLAFFALGDVRLHPEVLYGGPESAREVRYPSVASKEYPGQLWRVDLVRGVVERVPTGDVDLGQGPTPPAFQWTASGELLFRAPRLVEGSRPLSGSEPEWLVLGRNGRTRALIKGQNLPEELEAIEDGAAFLGLLDGEVIRIDVRKGTLKPLRRVDSVGANVQAIGGAGPTPHAIVSWLSTPRTETENAVVSSTFFSSDPQLFGMEHLVNYALLDLDTGETTPLRKPVPGAQLITYDVGSQSALWLANDRAGTVFWRRTGTTPSEPILARNTFWKDVAKSEQRMIEYTTLNGEQMKARLVLPLGYHPGRRYPLVVDFDIGVTAETNTDFPVRDSSALPSPYAEGFAAAGYVYMFASWPSTSMDQIGRANLLLGPNGILPAVEEAIALGIADPERLFLFGESSAGYGVLALVTQTSRFRAAATHAGWVDMITERLTPRIMERYTDNPFDLAPLGGARYIGSSLPFWRNGENYRRNSPLSYVDRVQTPLLILHGDLDVVAVTEPEMFFKALVMQRKPAQFVRYWGEGHGNQTPVNFRDYFQRIFAWFDQWGDIARDAEGNMVFEGDRVKSREGAPPLPAETYAKFPLFGPGGDRAIEAVVP